MTRADVADDEQHEPAAVLPPAIVIRIPLEGPPQSFPDVLTEGDAARLADYIRQHPILEELVAIASQAWLEMTDQDESGETFQL